MPVTKLITRLCLFAVLICAALVVLAVGVGSTIPGGTIAFAGYGKGHSADIFLVDTASSLIFNLTRHIALEDYQPLWSLDGNHLVFVAYSSDSSNIYTYTMNSDGNSFRQLAHFTPSVSFSTMTWSPDSKQISLSALDGTILVLEAATADACPISTSLIIEVECPYKNLTVERDLFGFSVDWSPVDDRILISIPGVFTVSPDCNIDQSFAEYGLADNARWSPDGLWIAFSTYSDEQGWQLVVIDRNGNHLRTFDANLTYQSAFTWSPDGTTLVYSAWYDGDGEIYSVNILSGEVRQLTNNSSEDTFPAPSPNGAWIAYLSAIDSFNLGLYVMNSDGSHIRQVADHVVSTEFTFSWRPQP